MFGTLDLELEHWNVQDSDVFIIGIIPLPLCLSSLHHICHNVLFGIFIGIFGTLKQWSPLQPPLVLFCLNLIRPSHILGSLTSKASESGN